jgi:tetratricopeptide (TPR) repeat protein
MYTALGLYEIGEKTKSINLYLKVLNWMNRDWQEEGQLHALVNYEIAYAYLLTKKYDSAIIYYSNALSVYEKKLKIKDARLADIYREMSTSSYYKGNNKDALTYALEAKEVTSEISGEDNLDYAQSLNDLAFIFLERKDFQKAIEYFQESLNIRKRNLSSTHLKVAESYNNLISVYYDFGFYHDALKYSSEYLIILENSSIHDQEKIASILLQNAKCYAGLGYYSESLAINIRIFGRSKRFKLHLLSK